MKTTRLLTAVLAATTALGAGGTAYAQGEAFETTTLERLLNADAEPHNWLLADANYSNWHYSQLDQINRDNVADLRVVYMVSLRGCMQPAPNGPRCNEMSWPRAENGILYVTDNTDRLMAFDVTSGDRAYPLWRFDPEADPANNARGIALYGDTVIQSVADGRLIAVDKASGDVVWEAGAQEPVDQPNSADVIATRLFPGSPQVYPTSTGRPIVIPSVRGAGVGWVAAYDATDGELVWRTYTIPLPGEPNFGTWPGETWRWGAAMPWGGPPAYDPDSNMLFVGTGEPSPVYDPQFRPGDNLYSVSTLALDADTGALMWYFQETPNDQWDFDSTSTRLLFDVVGPDGETVAAVSNWARNGFFYSLNRASGAYIRAVQQLENLNWTSGLDAKTGLPLEYSAADYAAFGVQEYAVAGPRRGRPEADAPEVCSTWGGAPTGIWPASYDPTTGITYQTRTTGCTYQTILRDTDEAFNPLQREGLGSNVRQVQVGTEFALVAIDTNTGAVVERYIRDQGITGTRQAEVGALATAGGLVFTGGDDGRISAHNSDTLEELWYFNTGTSLKGGIMSFAVNGNQYIAKIVGGDNPAGGGIGGLTMPAAMLVVWGL